jgi:hypothetical protein
MAVGDDARAAVALGDGGLTHAASEHIPWRREPWDRQRGTHVCGTRAEGGTMVGRPEPLELLDVDELVQEHPVPHRRRERGGRRQREHQRHIRAALEAVVRPCDRHTDAGIGDPGASDGRRTPLRTRRGVPADTVQRDREVVAVAQRPHPRLRVRDDRRGVGSWGVHATDAAACGLIHRTGGWNRSR